VARRGPTIAEAAGDLIREHGPLTLDALVPPIVAAGRTRAKDPRAAVGAALGSNADFLETADGRWCSLAVQLEGAVFTTPLVGLERREEIVLARNGLYLVERLLTRNARPLEGGGEVHLDWFADYFDLPGPSSGRGADDLISALGEAAAGSLLEFMDELGVPPGNEAEALEDLAWGLRDLRVLHGPPGWLPPLGGRKLLAIRVRDGMIETAALDRRSMNGPHVEAAAARVARLAEAVIGPDPSWFGPPVMEIETLLEIVATEAPEVFRQPLPPFMELVERGGLEIDEGLVGHRGTDWSQVRWALSPDPEDAWGYEPPDIVH
jgi:hypothetical protein